MILHKVSEEVVLKLVPYDFLKEMKLRSHREKDLWDVARLEEIRSTNK